MLQLKPSMLQSGRALKPRSSYFSQPITIGVKTLLVSDQLSSDCCSSPDTSRVFFQWFLITNAGTSVTRTTIDWARVTSHKDSPEANRLVLRFRSIIGQNTFRRKAHLLQTVMRLVDHLARTADQSDRRLQIGQNVVEQ